MRLYLIPDSYDDSGELVLTGSQFHYIVHVLRYRRGSEFEGRDKSGRGYKLRVKEIYEKSSVLEVKGFGSKSSELPEIVLYQCVCKGRKMDQIIRQASETGVTRIVPVVSDFSVVKTDSGNSGKTERWTRIVKEAIQQSGSMVNTLIDAPVTIDDLPVIDSGTGIGMFFHQESTESPVSLHEYLSTGSSRISIVIGSEGGLSDREIEILYRYKYKPVYLKTNILRAETAAIYAVSAVQTILLESENWRLKV